MTRDWLAQQFLYETGMFDNPREIACNQEHRLVQIAYKAADRILEATKQQNNAD